MTSKKPRTQRKPSQTTQILEHVESLLALHQNPENEASGLRSDPQSSIDKLFDSHSQDLVDSFESSHEKSHEKTVEIIRAVSVLIERRFESIEDRLNDILAATQSQPTLKTDQPKPAGSSPDADDSSPNWQQQKAAMLAKYGIDTDSQPSVEPPRSSKIANDTAHDPAIEKLEEIQESVNTLSVEDAKEIEDLKSELNSKLRDAEVEISIHRAKISQQTAELEKRQVELDRREASLEKQRAAHDSNGRKSGILDRFSRHLSSRKESGG